MTIYRLSEKLNDINIHARHASELRLFPEFRARAVVGSCSQNYISVVKPHLFEKKSTTIMKITFLIIWLAPRAGKMNQIARCDWLPERARWSDLARSGLPAVSREQNFPKSHIINPSLTKFARSR